MDSCMAKQWGIPAPWSFLRGLLEMEGTPLCLLLSPPEPSRMELRHRESGAVGGHSGSG